MRRSGSVVVALCLLLTGCGGGDKKADPGQACQDTATTKCQTKFTAKPYQPPTVSSDQLGVDPKIVSSTLPPDSTQLQVLHEGDGPAVKPGSFVAVDYKGQSWEPSGAPLPPFVNSFTTGDLFVTSIDKVVAGWSKKLPGVKVGSRVLLVVPPADAFGTKPPQNSGILPNDTLMFVIDVLGTFPHDQGPTGTPVSESNSKLPTVTGTSDPKISVPSSAAPTSLEQEVLVRGKGPKVAAGQWLAVQYTGFIWSSGKAFTSTWTEKAGASPEAIRMAAPGLLNGEPANGQIPGIVKGLVGRTVGSRILLVIPPAEGYGKNGLATAGISGTDTLVFVIDILGAYRTGEVPTASPTPSSTSAS